MLIKNAFSLNTNAKTTLKKNQANSIESDNEALVKIAVDYYNDRQYFKAAKYIKKASDNGDG